MDLRGGFERVFGRLFILFSLPTFVTLYALFASHLFSSSLSQDVSNLVSSLIHNGFITSLISGLLSVTGMFLVGLIGVIGAALVFLGSKNYEGFSKVGIQILVMSIISIVILEITTSVVLPLVVSKIGGGAANGINSVVSSLLSPVTSQILSLSIFFAVLGGVLIALKYSLPSILKKLSGKPAKGAAKKGPLSAISNGFKTFGEYFSENKAVSVPIGMAVFILVLAIFTLYNPGLGFSTPTYHTTNIAANSVSLSYQNAKSTAQVLNLSDFYLLSAPNENVTSSGSISISLSSIPLQFSLPLTLSVSKFGDPIRVSFNLDLSQLSSLLSSVAGGSSNNNNGGNNGNNNNGSNNSNNCNNQNNSNNSNSSNSCNSQQNNGNNNGNNNNGGNSGSSLNIPSDLQGIVLLNDSGVTTCINFNGSSNDNGALTCSFSPINENISKYLLNVDSSNENQSIIGNLFNVVTIPSKLFSGNSNNASSASSEPAFSFVNNVEYNGNDCSLFNVNATSDILNTTGQVCLSDTDGMPTFLDINYQASASGQTIIFNVNFGVTSLSNDVSLSNVDYLPPGAFS